MNHPVSRAAGIAAAALLLVASTAFSQVPSYYAAWGQSFNDTSAVSQFPHAMALDGRGNVFVTGHAIVGSAKGFYTAKYDSLDGHVVWQKELNGAGTNEFIANDVAVDSSGDCVVTGSRNVAGSIDYYTVKYSGVDGTLVWQKSFNGTNDSEDTALKVVCDGAKDVIVTGRSGGKNVNNSTGFDWVTIKYKSIDGTQLALDSYTQTSSNLDDVPAGLAVDSANNVFVVGTVQTALNVNRFYVRKLKSSDLTKLWDITPIDTGTGGADAEGGATAVAVDSNNNVVVTGGSRDAADHFGYFTIKFASAGSEVWRSKGPFSEDTFGTPYATRPVGSTRAKAIGIAIGPDNNPIVTGTLIDASGNPVSRTIKYTSAGFFGGGVAVWPTDAVDMGSGFGNTTARAIATDGASNAIIVGETQNADSNTDLYIAKYDAQTGERVYATSYTGSFGSSADLGVDVKVDRAGDIDALGSFVADKGTGIGLREFVTIKLNRLIAPTGQDLPDGITGVPDNAEIKLAGTPAIGASGVLAAKLSFKAGKKTGAALFVEGSAAGGTLLPAVKEEPAPVGVGDSAVNWVSFSDPVVAADGGYAFAAKVSGPGSKANGVWANLNGTLRLVFRQGSVIPVAGSTDKFSSLMNLGVSSGNLVALVKLSGPSSMNTALIRVDQNNVGTVLLRTGQTGLLIGGEDYTVKGISIFAPAKLESGDGRWQGQLGVVARVSAVKTSDSKSKTTAIVSISNTGTKNASFYTGQTAAAPLTGTYSGFGMPSTAGGTSIFATKATLTSHPAASNAALIYSLTGAAFSVFAEKGAATGVIGLPPAVTYADFSDPIVNTSGRVSYIATLKGSAAEVKSSTKQAIIFGSPALLRFSIARTGDFATDSAGDATSLKWTAFTALALPDGSSAGPVFIGKLSTSKNNLGLWAHDSVGDVRLLLRAGDHLGDLVVKKFTLLSVVPKSMSAARSFDSAGSVVVALSFTNRTTALLRIGIP